MAEYGDYSPIINGEIHEGHFLTDEAKMIFNFVTTYRETEGRSIGYPSRATIEARFESSNVHLPDISLAESVPQLAKEVRTRAFCAEMRTIAVELSHAADSPDPRNDAVDILGRLRKGVDDLSERPHLSFAEALPVIAEEYKSGGLLKEGLPWMWPHLHQATRGIHGKEFVIIAGRPKMRKTFIALAQAAHLVKNHHARVLFISPEMPRKQIMNRFTATFASVPYTEFKNGELPTGDEHRLMRLVADYGNNSTKFDESSYQMQLHRRISGMPEDCNPSFDVVEGANRNVDWIGSQVEIFQPDIVFIDSFYRLSTGQSRKSDADWKIVTQVSRAIKDLAMESGVAIVGTHQMNRSAEGKVGNISNLALADAIGQDADLILQAYTRRSKEGDETALAVLGGRETDSLGVVIKNVPCTDFSEVGPILNMKILEKFFTAAESDEEEEPLSEEEQRKQVVGRRSRNGDARGKRGGTPKERAARIVSKSVGREIKNTPPPVRFGNVS